MVKKAINLKTKVKLQPFFRTREIESKCLRSFRLFVKKDNNNAN